MIVIKVAERKTELEEAFKLRHLVYKTQDGKFPNVNFSGEMIRDEFDFNKERTIVLVAYKDGKTIGTIRCVEDFEDKLPLVDDYSIDKLRRCRGYKSPLFAVGMLAVDENYRRSKGLLANLFRFLTALAIERGCKDAVATINHAIAPLVSRLGFKKIADRFWSASVGNWIVPVYATEDDFAEVLFEETVPPELILFTESSERRIYNSGEILCKEGERGDSAFFIKRGSVSVLKRQCQADYKIAILGARNLVGEMTLYGDKTRRSATIKANTETVVMVLERQKLLNALGDSKKAEMLLNILTDRICQLNSRIAGGREANIYGAADYTIPVAQKLLVQSQRIREMNERLTAARVGGKIGKDLVNLLATLYYEKLWDDYLVDDSQEIYSVGWIALQIGATEQELLPFIAQLLKAGVIKQEEGGEITVLDVDRLKDFVFEIEI